MQTNSNFTDSSLLIPVKNACQLISSSRNTTMKLAEEANAVVRIGRVFRINKDLLIDYISNNYKYNNK